MSEAGERTPEFAVLVLERVENGRTEEHHSEVMTFDEALARIAEAHVKLPSWVAITLVHASDYPRVLDAAVAGEPAEVTVEDDPASMTLDRYYHLAVERKAEVDAWLAEHLPDKGIVAVVYVDGVAWFTQRAVDGNGRTIVKDGEKQYIRGSRPIAVSPPWLRDDWTDQVEAP